MATAGTTSAPDLRRHPCGFAPPVRSLPLHDHRHGPAFAAFFRARIAVYFAESGVAIVPAAFFEKKKEGYLSLRRGWRQIDVHCAGPKRLGEVGIFLRPGARLQAGHTLTRRGGSAYEAYGHQGY